MTKIYTIFCREQGSDGRSFFYTVATDEEQVNFYASQIKECRLELTRIDVYSYDFEICRWIKDKFWSKYITDAYIKNGKIFKIL